MVWQTALVGWFWKSLTVTPVERRDDCEVLRVKIAAHGRPHIVLLFVGIGVLLGLVARFDPDDRWPVALGLLLSWSAVGGGALILFNRAARPARVTVHADRVHVDVTRSKLQPAFNRIRYHSRTIGPEEAVLVRHIGGYYRVRGSASSQDIVSKIKEEAVATELAETLNAALQRIRSHADSIDHDRCSVRDTPDARPDPADDNDTP